MRHTCPEHTSQQFKQSKNHQTDPIPRPRYTDRTAAPLLARSARRPAEGAAASQLSSRSAAKLTFNEAHKEIHFTKHWIWARTRPTRRRCGLVEYYAASNCRGATFLVRICPFHLKCSLKAQEWKCCPNAFKVERGGWPGEHEVQLQPRASLRRVHIRLYVFRLALAQQQQQQQLRFLCCLYVSVSLSLSRRSSALNETKSITVIIYLLLLL